MAAPASSDVLPLIDQLVEQAYTFSAAIGRWSATILAELELTEALGDVLWQLGAVGQAVSMRDLAGRRHELTPGASVARGPAAPLPAVRQVLTAGTAGVVSSD